MNYDTKRYGNLLADVLPAHIETEAENERILSIIQNLMKKGENNLSPEEERLLNLLVDLVEKFEEKTYRFKSLNPLENLTELMQMRDLKQKDLVPIFGSQGITSEVLSGKRTISKTQAKKLAEFFHVSVELFI